MHAFIDTVGQRLRSCIGIKYDSHLYQLSILLHHWFLLHIKDTISTWVFLDHFDNPIIQLLHCITVFSYSFLTRISVQTLSSTLQTFSTWLFVIMRFFVIMRCFCTGNPRNTMTTYLSSGFFWMSPWNSTWAVIWHFSYRYPTPKTSAI